jgi:thiol-disulfide isomerase/thioredoxin
LKKILLTILLISSVFALPKLGDKAPTFFTKKLDGSSFFLSDSLEKKNPIVLSFFATWCGPCRIEIPILDSLSTVYKDTDFYLVNVSGLKQGNRTLKEDPKMVKEMINSLKTSIPVLMDKYGVAAEKYGALALPTTAIINPKGEIVYIHTGFAVGDEKEIISVLESNKKVKVEN